MTGKKIDDAIKAGLKELGVSLAEVNVEILQQGGLFRKAKVRLTVVEDDQPAKEKAVVKAQKEEKVVNKEPKEVKAAHCEAKQQQKPVQKTEKPAVKPSGEVKEKKESRPANSAVKEKKPVADTRGYSFCGSHDTHDKKSWRTEYKVLYEAAGYLGRDQRLC